MRTALSARMALHLTSAERAEGRDALVSYMRAHPLPEASLSWFDALHSLLFSRAPAFALSALIIVVGGGAVAYAAESAIPGDPLYAFKVDVLEPLREKVIRAPEKRAAWQIRKVERRLGEARKLAAAGRLTPEYRANIERRISQQVVTLNSTSMPPTSVETHIAAQEVLAVTFDTYEQSVASNTAPAVFGASQDTELEPEADHLLKFVQERGMAARSEARHAIATAIGDDRSSSSASVEASAIMKVMVTATGAEKKERSGDSVASSSEDQHQEEKGRDGVKERREKKEREEVPEREGETEDQTEDQQEDARIHLPIIDLRDEPSSASVQSASSVASSVSTQASVSSSSSTSVEMDADKEIELHMDSSVPDEASSSSKEEEEEEKESDLLKKIEHQKEIIERQLRRL